MNEQPSKIYLLPNLMTAGNLFCGFTATLKILEGALLQASNPDAAGDLFHTANHATAHTETKNSFTGFPIPAAAGLIASITLFLLWLAEGEHRLGNWKFVLPPLLLFLSFMMFSHFQYPSFKAVNWKTKKSIPRFLIISLILIFTVMNYEWMPAVLFLAYLLYGVFRSWLSREWRREIEEEIGEESEEPAE